MESINNSVENTNPMEKYEKAEPGRYSAGSGKKKLFLGLFFLLIILVVIGGAAFWFWQTNQQKESSLSEPNNGQVIERPVPTATPTPLPEDYDEITVMMEKDSGSDEIEDIEKDLMDTDLSSLDRELEQIEQEF